MYYKSQLKRVEVKLLNFDLSKGTTNTIDLSSYSGYENFNEDDFFLEVIGYAAAAYSSKTSFTNTVYITKSYDKDTGILTIKAPQENYGGSSIHLKVILYIIRI